MSYLTFLMDGWTDRWMDGWISAIKLNRLLAIYSVHTNLPFQKREKKNKKNIKLSRFQPAPAIRSSAN